MIKKIIDIDKLKGYPQNSYAFLWIILCFAVVLVPLTSMVLINKAGSTQASAAVGATFSGCTFSPASVDVGKSIMVTSSRGNVFGKITIQGAYLDTSVSLGTLPKQKSVSVVIPSVPSGLYAVRVGSPAVNCKTATGGDLAIQNIVTPTPTPTPLPAPACVLNVASVSPGGSVRVTSIGGLFGTIGMQGVFGSPVYSALGSLPANGFASITVPDIAQAGQYTVRVGTLGVPCSPNLSVTALSSPLPTSTPTPIAASCGLSVSSIKVGGSITVTGKGFTGLTYTANLLGLSTTQFYTLGQFNGTSGTYIVPTVPGGVYTVRVFSGNTADNGVMCSPDLIVF